jgi:hypothetical protein
MHISRRMRIIALQSAVGGRAFSVIGIIGMVFAAISGGSGAIHRDAT